MRDIRVESSVSCDFVGIVLFCLCHGAAPVCNMFTLLLCSSSADPHPHPHPYSYPYLKAQNPGGHSIGVPVQVRALLTLIPTTKRVYPKREKRLDSGVFWQDNSPSVSSSIDLSQDDTEDAGAASGAGALSLHTRSGICAGSVDYINDSSCSSSSSSGLSLIQLWMQYTDAVGAGLFRAPQGPLFFSKALSDGANRALHPRRAADVVGNKQGRRRCRKSFLNFGRALYNIFYPYLHLYLPLPFHTTVCVRVCVCVCVCVCNLYLFVDDLYTASSTLLTTDHFGDWKSAYSCT